MLLDQSARSAVYVAQTGLIGRRPFPTHKTLMTVTRRAQLKDGANDAGR